MEGQIKGDGNVQDYLKGEPKGDEAERPGSWFQVPGSRFQVIQRLIQGSGIYPNIDTMVSSQATKDVT